MNLIKQDIIRIKAQTAALKELNKKSACCDAVITETGFCTDCWEHA